MTADDKVAYELYDAWRAAERLANDILAEVDDDMQHPRYQNAARAADEKLGGFLSTSKPSIAGALLKLQAACYFEDYCTDAANPASNDLAPRVIVSAMRDLEKLLGASV